MSSFEYFYGEYGDVEQEFLAAIDTSLQPRGPDMLYDVVADLQLGPSTRVLDLGCGDGKYALELARRFGFTVIGIDPYQDAGADAVERVTFQTGRAEQLPLDDGSVELIWCRDTLVHIEDLRTAVAECRRVLRAGGHMVILHSLATDRMAPHEAGWLWSTMHVVPATTDPTFFEAAFADTGFAIQRQIDIGSEWREYREESTGQNRLLHAARMLRQPERFIARFGRDAYDIMLGDCYWHIYQLLGKLSYRIYVLRAS